MPPTVQNDFWNGTTGFWDTNGDWSTGEPGSSTPAVIGGGDVTLSSPQQQEANFLSVGGAGGAPAEATLTTNGTLTTGALYLGNANVNGSGIIDTTLFQQGSFFDDDENSYASVMNGSLNIVADTIDVGGGKDEGFALDGNATLTATGASTIYQGFIRGTGTLQNGTASQPGPSMTFANSAEVSSGNIVTNGGSPYNNITTIGSFINWGTAVFTTAPAQQEIEGFIASAITNTSDGIIQFGGGNSGGGLVDGDISAKSFVNNGGIIVYSGTASIGEAGNTALSGNGNIQLGPQTNLIIKPGSSVGNGQTIDFQDSGSAILQLDGSAAALAASFQGTIEYYNTGDEIYLPNVAFSSITAIGPNAANTAITVATGTGIINFNVAGGPFGILTAKSDGGSGTELTFNLSPTYNFTNGAGDLQWATQGNWSVIYGGGVPTITDNATISSYAVTIAAGQAEDAGSLTLNGTAEVDDQGSLFIENALTIGSGQTFYLDGGSLGFSGSQVGVTVASGGLFKGGTGDSAFEDTLVDNGTVEATAGQTLELFDVTGNGTLQIDSGATLEADVSLSLTADFNGPNAQLKYEYVPGNFIGPTLDHLQSGDSLYLGGFDSGTASYSIGSNSNLTITSGTNTATFALTNKEPGLEFILSETGYGNLIASATENIPPVITAPGDVLALGSNAADVSGVSITDADPTYTNITVAVTLSGPGSLGMNDYATSGSLMTGKTVTASGSAANITTDLSTLYYVPASSALQLANITVMAVNNGPANISNTAIPQTIEVASGPADAFVATASGDWSIASVPGTPGTWESNGVPSGIPGATDDGIVAGPYDVTVSDSESVNSLLILSPQSEVDISGTLSLENGQSAIDVAGGGTLGLFGGTITGHGGTLDLSSGNLVSQPYSFSEGELDDVNVTGVLNVTGNMTIQDGFSIVSANGVGPGQINVSLQDGFNPISLDFAGTYTLQDTTVTLNGANVYFATLDGDDLTIDGHSTVLENNGGAISGTIVTNDGTIIAGSTEYGSNNALGGSGGFAQAGGDFINNGSIIVDSSLLNTSGTFNNAGSIVVDGGTFDIGPLGIFKNAGSITVDSGEFAVGQLFSIGGTFDNTGTVTVENSGTFYVASSASVTSLGVIIGSGNSTTELGGTITNSGTFYYDDPATLILDDPASFGGAIGGFGGGDVLILTGETITAGSISNDLLTVTLAGGGTQSFHVTPGQQNLTFSETSTGGLMTNTPCFAAGTRILTPRGEVAVENLEAGDLVITSDGEDAPIIWIGHRTIDLTRHSHPEQAQPIRINADALADGVPGRDLVLSPDHALHLHGHLIPAKALTNKTNIIQLNRRSVTYYHIELAEHSIIFAENTAVETYLETGNRGAFENGGAALTLYPDFATTDFQAMREAKSCAPFAEAGPVVNKARLGALNRSYREQDLASSRKYSHSYTKSH